MVGRVDCDWGLNGLRALARGRIVIIVDVLSFSTATTVAVSGGAEILPCIWDQEKAKALAAAENAELASKRGQGPFSLAPASLRKLRKGVRLVLPSPNGSTLACAAMELGPAAIAIGCIRNASAVASWASRQNGDVAVIAAGERWPDRSIRFAIEDWLGAGAIVSGLTNRSHNAEAAAAAFERLRTNLHQVLESSPSGQELISAGYPDDIEIASELNGDRAVPLLRGNAFTLADL
jgi:2-phosphosulfolactate phosphatase